jgi:hypothetical protein
MIGGNESPTRSSPVYSASEPSPGTVPMLDRAVDRRAIPIRHVQIMVPGVKSVKNELTLRQATK